MRDTTRMAMFFAFCCATACGRAQGEPPRGESSTGEQATAAQDGKRLVEEMLAKFKAEKIEVDLEHKTVTIPVVVNRQLQDPVEYLLIHRRGKRHEAIFYTESQPSVLNGALLMIGFEQGKNASVKDIEPPPTIEQIEQGAETVIITPPAGKPFWMTVKWQDAAGKTVEYCAEDMVLDLTTQEAVTDCSWVYLGARIAQIYKNEPEVYVADFEGNLISICYLLPDNHLGTMVHKDARDDQNWWLTDKVPPPGTELQFVFHASKPELVEERERRLAAEKEAAGK